MPIGENFLRVQVNVKWKTSFHTQPSSLIPRATIINSSWVHSENVDVCTHTCIPDFFVTQKEHTVLFCNLIFKNLSLYLRYQ